MPSVKQEQKALPALLIKAEEDTGIVEAIVSVFGVLDSYDDIILPGAYTKTIVERGRKVRVLNAHNSWNVNDVIGIALEMREVAREELPQVVQDTYPEASGGLWTRTQYLMDTPEGRGAFARIKAGAVDEYSIGYQCLQFEFKEIEMRGRKVVARLIKEIKLWEYSPVVWGANPATATVGVKSDADSLYALVVEYAQKAGRTLSSTNEQRIKDAVRALLDVLDDAGIALDTGDSVEEEATQSPDDADKSAEPPALLNDGDTALTDMRAKLRLLIQLHLETTEGV